MLWHGAEPENERVTKAIAELFCATPAATDATSSSIDWAAWFSAIGTVAAVVWGVALYTSEVRRRKREQRGAIHEVAAASETVASSWDAVADRVNQPDGWVDAPTAQALVQRLDISAEVLDRLLNRADLTDGAIRRGVASRHLALGLARDLRTLIVDAADPLELSVKVHEYPDLAQQVLSQSRSLRVAHKIDPPRQPYAYAILDPNKP